MDKEIKLLNQIEDLIYDLQIHKMPSRDPFLNTLGNFRNEVLEQIKFLEALVDKQKEIKAKENRLAKFKKTVEEFNNQK